MKLQSKVTQSEIQNAPMIACVRCKSVIFARAYQLRHVSKIISMDGKDKIVASPPRFICINCGLLLGDEPKGEENVIDKTQSEKVH